MNKTLLLTLAGSSLVLLGVLISTLFITEANKPLFFYSSSGYIALLQDPCIADHSKKTLLVNMVDDEGVHSMHGCYNVDSANIVHAGSELYPLSMFTKELPPLGIRSLS